MDVTNYSFGVRGKGDKAGAWVGGWGPSPWEHLLGVKTEELCMERQRGERREEASDRMSYIEAA